VVTAFTLVVGATDVRRDVVVGETVVDTGVDPPELTFISVQLENQNGEKSQSQNMVYWPAARLAGIVT
jgi:hypothetical protein